MGWEGSDAGTTVVNSGGTGGDVPPTDQSRKRSYAIYTDQHGRPWGANIENKTGDPCGPLEPQGWHAPAMPLDRYISINSRQRKIFIRYDDMILDIEQAHEDWRQSLQGYATKMYGMQAGAAIQNPPPELLNLAGEKPKGRREIWEAAKTGNKWILGLNPTKPSWAEEFFPEVVVTKKDRLVEITRAYPDADEVVKKGLKWTGPQTGWQLSDGTYVPRLEGEDKDAYKARAESLEE